MDWYVLGKQLRRNMCSLRMLSVCIASLLLMVIQYWTTHHASYAILDSEPTFLREVMLFSQYGTGTGLYLFLVPFLAALLGSGVVALERHDARFMAVAIRAGRTRFLRTSMMSGILSGAIGGVMPLVINLCVAAAANPYLSFIEGTEVDAHGTYIPKYVLISSRSWMYPLYQQSQILCIIVMVLLVAVISGLYAAVGVGASLFLKRRHVELIVPFVSSLGWWMLPALTNGLVPDQWSHIIFLHIGPGDIDELRIQNVVGLVLTICLLSAAAVALLLVGERQDER